MFSPLEQFDIIPILWCTHSIFQYNPLYHIFVPAFIILAVFISFLVITDEFKLIPWSIQRIFDYLFVLFLI